MKTKKQPSYTYKFCNPRKENNVEEDRSSNCTPRNLGINNDVIEE